MNKMEVEFTDEQLERVKRLEAHDISVGDAIDMLFEVRDKVSTNIDNVDWGKLEEIENEENEDTVKTYDVAIEDYKSHISWAHDFFKL